MEVRTRMLCWIQALPPSEGKAFLQGKEMGFHYERGISRSHLLAVGWVKLYKGKPLVHTYWAASLLKWVTIWFGWVSSSLRVPVLKNLYYFFFKKKTKGAIFLWGKMEQLMENWISCLPEHLNRLWRQNQVSKLLLWMFMGIRIESLDKMFKLYGLRLLCLLALQQVSHEKLYFIFKLQDF